MPFLSAAGPTEAVRLSFLLLCVNAIYLWRAKTEERHLAGDPVYVEFARWVDFHALLAKLKPRVDAPFQSRRADEIIKTGCHR